MTEHELTKVKIAELHNRASRNLHLLAPWSLLSDTHKARQTSFARAAYDLGKQASTAQPELPTEVGSVIYDVVDVDGDTYRVMTLDSEHDWLGTNERGSFSCLKENRIASFGGVLDLDKVRSGQ